MKVLLDVTDCQTPWQGPRNCKYFLDDETSARVRADGDLRLELNAIQNITLQRRQPHPDECVQVFHKPELVHHCPLQVVDAGNHAIVFTKFYEQALGDVADDRRSTRVPFDLLRQAIVAMDVELAGVWLPAH